jgi:hypothetical protein
MTSVRKARKRMDRWRRYWMRYPNTDSESQGCERAYRALVRASYMTPVERERVRRDKLWLEEAAPLLNSIHK